jgi:hypothetical protein
MRGIGRRDLPLAPGQVRHAVHAHPAVAPRLSAGPLDEVVHVVDLLLTHPGEVALRPPASTHVRIDDDVAVAAPVDRVGRFESRVLVEVGVMDARVAHGVVADIPVLAIRAPGDEGRVGAGPVRTKHVGVDLRAVAHVHRDVVFDDHARVVLARRGLLESPGWRPVSGAMGGAQMDLRSLDYPIGAPLSRLRRLFLGDKGDSEGAVASPHSAAIAGNARRHAAPGTLLRAPIRIIRRLIL